MIQSSILALQQNIYHWTLLQYMLGFFFFFFKLMLTATIQLVKISEAIQMPKSPQFEIIFKSISNFIENLTADTVNKISHWHPKIPTLHRSI